MMGHRTRLKTGEEYDCFSTNWRKMLCMFYRPGVVKKIKAQHNRRERHRIKQELNQEIKK